MEEKNKQSWWHRNWKWALPTGGCLTIIIVAIAFLSYGVYKAKDYFSENSSLFTFINVIQEVQRNDEVRESLGTPMTFDDLENENFDPSLNTDSLDLDFEIQGKDSDGTVRVIANRTDSGWSYSTFTVTVKDTGAIIDLKDEANE